MNELIEIFDQLLTLMVSYPITMFHILFSPSKIISAATDDALISPPGASLIISFYVYHLSHVTEIRARYHLKTKLSFLPRKDFVIKVFLLVIFILLAQYLSLLIPKVLSNPSNNPLLTVKTLSYPISLAMAVFGLIYMLYFIFPFGSKTDDMTLEEKFDKNFREVRKESKSKRIVAIENAKFLAMGATLLVYGLSSFNTLRTFFSLSSKQTILPLLTVLVATGISAGFVVWIFLRYEKFVERLQAQEKIMPEKDDRDMQ
jgi:hypothetical protein